MLRNPAKCRIALHWLVFTIPTETRMTTNLSLPAANKRIMKDFSKKSPKPHSIRPLRFWRKVKIIFRRKFSWTKIGNTNQFLRCMIFCRIRTLSSSEHARLFFFRRRTSDCQFRRSLYLRFILRNGIKGDIGGTVSAFYNMKNFCAPKLSHA